MQTTISEWLESKTGESKRQMALRIGQQPSTFNRNIGTAEVIIAVCRAYGMNPIEGLIAAGLIETSEAASFTGKFALQDVTESDLLHEMLRRVERGGSGELTRPITSDDISDALDHEGDPDYSNMSEADAMNYGLAAFKGEENIAHDELPHES